jgi:adenylate cyclase
MSQRRLAAIMFTDIVGYTALMGKDEEQTLNLLKKNINIHKALIRKFHGEFIKDIGDGILVSFTTNLNAVRCAIALQQASRKENYQLRIGIHEGDLVFSKGDAWGDGVNVASRLQELAGEGCIVISGSVYKDIKNKTDISVRYLDEKKLKNVEDPLKIYQVSSEERETGKLPSDPSRNRRKKTFSGVIYVVTTLLILLSVYLIWHFFPDEPTPDLGRSIAVIPFKNLSDSPGEQYLADGMMDAILNHLQKIKELEVRSRTSVEQFRDARLSLSEIGEKLNVNYIIEGSFQKVGNEANLVVQLLLAGEDRHIWAGEYTKDWSDIFSVQSEVAQTIAIELKMILTQEEQVRITENPTKSLSAYDFYLRGKENHIRYFFSHSDQDFNNAVELFRRALTFDPEFALAYADLSWTFWWKRTWSGGSDTVKYLDSALHYCNIALTVDPDLSEAYTLQGLYYTATGKIQEAFPALKHALMLNPNDPRAYRFLGLLNHSIGNHEESINNYLKSEKLEHSSYDLLILRMKMAEFYQEIGNFDKAEIYLDELMALEPDFVGGYLWYGWLETVQGNFENAYEAYCNLLEQVPDESHNIWSRQAETLAYLKRYTESEAVWEKALASKSITGKVLCRNNFRYAYTLWMNGKKDIARKIFDDCISFWIEEIKSGGFDPKWGIYYNLAGIHALLGDKPEAIKWLNKQAEAGFTIRGDLGFLYAYERFIEYDPLFDSVREEAEFRRIVLEAQEEKARIRKRVKKIEDKGKI